MNENRRSRWRGCGKWGDNVRPCARICGVSRGGRVQRRKITMKGRTSRFAERVALLGVVLLAVGAARVAGQQTAANGPAIIDMTLAKPETVGFSPERLERLHTLMQQVVDEKQLPG